MLSIKTRFALIVKAIYFSNQFGMTMNVFKMNAMGDYHDLYLKRDVLLLGDVFEKFINTC